jgi:hypothetical protein
VVSFEVVSLGSHTPLPAGPPLQEAALDVFFREAIQYLRRGSLDVINCTEMVTFKAIFHIREKEKVTGSQIWGVGWLWENGNLFRGQKLPDRQRAMAGYVVMVQKSS